MQNFDFKNQVLDQSYEKPVVVDFWAEWCGPCRVLGPTIEQLATEQKDKWTLVKVNTEEAPEVAQQYQIMSIPNVKMFYKGEEIADFVGALPRSAIQNWLEENLPDERKNDLADLLRNAESNAEAIMQLEQFVADNPDVPEAKIALAQRLVFRTPEDAKQLVADMLEGHKHFDQAEDVRTLAELMTFESDGSSAGEKLKAAQKAAKAADFERAIQEIIAAATIDKTLQKGLPRRAAIAFFRSWGDTHSLTKNYRWRFDMALY